MGTRFSEVITGAFMTETPDVRMGMELGENQAAFFRKYAGLLMEAVPRFDRPPEAESWLRYRPPRSAGYLYTAPEPLQDAPLTVSTGQTGFELCSCGTLTVSSLGNPVYTPLSGNYDSETGTVTFAAVTLAAGGKISFDFYADGEFCLELNGAMTRILALCMQYVWESRFATDYLVQTPKVQDSAFKTSGTESGLSRANTERLRYLKASLNDELCRFEQSLVYRGAIPETEKIAPPEEWKEDMT